MVWCFTGDCHVAVMVHLSNVDEVCRQSIAADSHSPVSVRVLKSDFV